MKLKTLKITPHFEYRVWAGDQIKQHFNLEENSIGEAWIISALKDKSSTIQNLNKQSLLDFYNNKDNAYFFNNYNLNNPYPLLSKIIDANADLSVQIHPDNAYAKQFNSLGKTECWYILNTKPNNSIVLGHNAKSLAEFKQMVENNQWSDLLKQKPINKNDFIYVESTKIHAIKGGSLIFELQQSSDITYRVYDYDRLDKGKKRELHLDHVYNLVKCPDVIIDQHQVSNKSDYLVANDLFHLKEINNKNKTKYKFNDAEWLQVTIIEGSGYINDLSAQQYDSFLVAHNQDLIIDGSIKCLVSYVTK
ncbi:type I phosphomannose isomerase catalytic subunit [Mycoplasma sp. E35C]|uniref:type I phosphomannose isomerase catalytic subunit n=1 Tax=Mycoplasma sp. E35C TaxID=2801918 RepID=UPI001CA426E4|nr:type I phosphomannose isomerase catalytic subunit [Mycoplasma sp. E35C]QZX49104.1 class I mannose-6-phosphate isomerase [Mycoplasma sp. E35C]